MYRVSTHKIERTTPPSTRKAAAFFQHAAGYKHWVYAYIYRLDKVFIDNISYRISVRA